ncbi:MAG: Na+/H+ antiporter subunit E [Nitrososphaerota archaeon]|nr:Na+/H+ antiporter subunit E [Nitrososphaerales archaeon]MDW8044500.1 Na+/H+ antiporter subunit E [Nitrososphaerota archaeon]
MKLARIILIAIPLYISYMLFSGSASLFDLFLGLIIALLISSIFSNLFVEKTEKLIDVRRWAWFIAYFIHYLTIDEFKAHLDVIKRILHPKMPINPGIVRTPYRVETEYGLVLTANSITNTPGTVVVDYDENRKLYYVHWIDVKSPEEVVTESEISEPFARFARRIFD